MNKKNALMTGLAVLSMVMSGTGLTGCSNQSEANPTTQNVKKKVTLGKKTDTSKKITFKNKTGKAITVFETKSTNDESFSDNLLKDGTVIESKQSAVVYFEPKENENLNIKLGLKDDDTTYTFEKVDESLDTAKSFEIKLNDDKKPTISITKKDDSITSIESSKEETKSDDETKNEEKADETAKAEESSSESKSDLSTSSDNKTNTTTATTTTSKNNSSSGSSSSSQHTHNWEPIYETVSVPEQGHYENVLVKEAYDEQWPEYEMVEHSACNICGIDLTANGLNPADHTKQHVLNGDGNGGDHSIAVKVLTGYSTIHHDAEYSQQYVVDQAATTKQVLKGYKCTSCGKTK